MNWYNNSYRIILHTRFGFKSLTSPAQPVRNPSNTGSHFEFLHETLSFGREKKNDKVSDLARQYVVNHKEEIIEQFAGKKRFIKAVLKGANKDQQALVERYEKAVANKEIAPIS